MKAQSTYQTQNRALAITLATCGVKFARDEAHGCDVPFVNVYDLNILRQKKDGAGRLLFKDMTFEAAARAAYKMGIPGLLVYNFIRDEVCERVIKTFDKTSKEIEGAAALGKVASLSVNVSLEDAVRLCVQFTQNRNKFTNGWKTARPYLHVPGKSESHTEGNKVVTIGSFRLVRLKVVA